MYNKRAFIDSCWIYCPFLQKLAFLKKGNMPATLEKGLVPTISKNLWKFLKKRSRRRLSQFPLKSTFTHLFWWASKSQVRAACYTRWRSLSLYSAWLSANKCSVSSLQTWVDHFAWSLTYRWNTLRVKKGFQVSRNCACSTNFYALNVSTILRCALFSLWLVTTVSE